MNHLAENDLKFDVYGYLYVDPICKDLTSVMTGSQNLFFIMMLRYKAEH